MNGSLKNADWPCDCDTSSRVWFSVLYEWYNIDCVFAMMSIWFKWECMSGGAVGGGGGVWDEGW